MPEKNFRLTGQITNIIDAYGNTRCGNTFMFSIWKRVSPLVAMRARNMLSDCLLQEYEDEQ